MSNSSTRVNLFRSYKCFMPNGSQKSDLAQNAMFHFEKGHEIPLRAMKEQKQRFSPWSARAEFGPPLFGRILRAFLNREHLTNMKSKHSLHSLFDHLFGIFSQVLTCFSKGFDWILFTHQFCSFLAAEVEILPNAVFTPLLWPDTVQPWTKQRMTSSKWRDVIGCSSAIHFYSSLTASWKVTGDQSHELYSFLAPDFCPLSFHPLKQFWKLISSKQFSFNWIISPKNGYPLLFHSSFWVERVRKIKNFSRLVANSESTPEFWYVHKRENDASYKDLSNLFNLGQRDSVFHSLHTWAFILFSFSI